MYLLQTGSYDVSIHPRHLSVLPTVVFHPCCRQDIQTTLLSSTSHRLEVPPVRLSTVSKRAFPVSGATVWNDLPLHVASAPSLAVFRKRLKTFPFSFSYQNTIIGLTLLPFITTVWTSVVLSLININAPFTHLHPCPSPVNGVSRLAYLNI